jgi:tetratricopeptide (TPR) repeat protein
MRASGITGREASRNALLEAWDGASRGRGRLVLVTGEPGMGKTTLARDLADEARHAGASTRWAACWPGGATVAHAPWITVLTGLGAAGEPAMAALLGSDDAEAGNPAAAASARALAYALVLTALETASTDAPLVLVFDDLHWADAGTVQLLAAAAGQLPALRVLVVGTYRDGDVLPGSPLTLVGSSADRLGLTGVPPEGVAELLAGALGRTPEPATVAAVHERTAGNPFLVVQLARLLADDPDALAANQPTLPTGARDLLGGRLIALDEDDRGLLAAAAVLGSPFTTVDLAATTGRAPDAVEAALDRAVTNRVVERRSSGGAWAFIHDLFRQAAAAPLSSADQSRLHRAAAAVLAGTDAEPAVVARHLLAAAGGPDAEAAAWATRAGERALAAMAWEEATAHFERALAATPTSETGVERAEPLQGLGRARLLAGDVAGATRAFEELAAIARAAGSPALLAEAALGFTADFAGFEVRLFDQRQIDLLEQAAAALSPDGHAGLRASVLARLSVALSLAAPDDRRLALAEEAVELARNADDTIVLARALASHCDALSSPDHVDRRFDESSEIVRIAEQAADAPLELLGRRLRYVAALERGDIVAADAEAAAFARRATAVGNPLYSWYVSLWRAQKAVVEGNLRGARQAIHEAKQQGEAAGSQNATMLVLVADWMLRLRAGEYDAASRSLAELVVDQPEMVAQLGPTAGEARTALLAGRTAEARTLLDRYDANGFDSVPFDAEWLAVLVAVVDTAAQLDHPILPEAVDRLAPYAHLFAFEGIGAGVYGSVARFLAVGRSAQGAHDEAVALARQALAANRAAGGMLVGDGERTLAQCLAARGRIGDATDAEDHHRRADAIFREAGLLHLVRDEAARASAPAEQADKAPPNALLRDGDVWHMTFGGATTIVKHSKGIADLAVLLAEPGRDVHVSELEGVPRALLGGDGGDAIDRRAVAAYRERLTELAEEIDDADAAHDLVRAERARVEYDALVDQLSGSFGLGGRARSAGAEPVERLRKAVAARIRDAVRRIDAALPALGRHLTNSVKTGTFCSYRPETPVLWHCESRSGARGA